MYIKQTPSEVEDKHQKRIQNLECRRTAVSGEHKLNMKKRKKRGPLGDDASTREGEEAKGQSSDAANYKVNGNYLITEH